nr:hypothetical protein JVH1_3511 [Rhodococcus sp. JVH1]
MVARALQCTFELSAVRRVSPQQCSALRSRTTMAPKLVSTSLVGRLCLRLQGSHQVLVRELVEPVPTELATDSGVPHSAERQVGLALMVVLMPTIPTSSWSAT